MSFRDGENEYSGGSAALQEGIQIESMLSFS